MNFLDASLNIMLHFTPCAYLLCATLLFVRSRVNTQWIRWFCAGLMVNTILYVIWVFTNSEVMRLIVQLYCLIYCLIVAYQELYRRLTETKETPREHSSNPLTNSSCTSPVWLRTIKLMEDKQAWRNPDLTLVELASLVGTNRTTLSNQIREAGFDGFYSLINTCRIKEFLHIITNNEIESIQETFYAVGFRSKSTAIRYFRQQTGTTPSEYLQKKIVGSH